MFTEQDIEQIGAHGLCVADAERQMLRFREGFPYLDICRAAVAGDGILQADGAAAERYGAVYRELRPQRKVVKFVPASGAATRMFKALFEFLNDGVRSREAPPPSLMLPRFCRTACGVYRRQPRSANRGLEYPDRRARLRDAAESADPFSPLSRPQPDGL